MRRNWLGFNWFSLGMLASGLGSPCRDSCKYGFMQIHRRLTHEQRDLIGENDDNAPPVLKVYWNKGYV